MRCLKTLSMMMLVLAMGAAAVNAEPWDRNAASKATGQYGTSGRDWPDTYHPSVMGTIGAPPATVSDPNLGTAQDGTRSTRSYSYQPSTGSSGGYRVFFFRRWR